MSDEPTLLLLKRAKPPFFAGVDVGGTNIKIGIVDDRGDPVAYTSIPTNQDEGPQAAAQRAAEALGDAADKIGLGRQNITRLGLATPGPMDVPNGMLVCPGNLPAWHNTPVRDLFAKATSVDVTYANDANAAAWGEYWRGAGETYNSMVMLTLGTGVGGGIVINNSLVVGEHSCGAEIGHIIIDSASDAPENSLGIRGTLEGYCGAYGVVAQAQRLLDGSMAESSLRQLDRSSLTPKQIAEAADQGDELAMRVVMQTARYLAIGIVTCVHTIDPDSVVIGGGMDFGGPGTTLGDKFMDEVRSQSQRRMIETLRDKVHIDFAKLGGDAGYIGVAGLARQDA